MCVYCGRKLVRVPIPQATSTVIVMFLHYRCSSQYCPFMTFCALFPFVSYILLGMFSTHDRIVILPYHPSILSCTLMMLSYYRIRIVSCFCIIISSYYLIVLSYRIILFSNRIILSYYLILLSHRIIVLLLYYLIRSSCSAKKQNPENAGSASSGSSSVSKKK